ncbi:PREDICTED: uncharacterized protein LOC104821189 [Tarenaya hassleriana]|uniref:uncharacterized protein LOC104821189 n=1 Tax=Tarenaya hassleriana TaxID=28532 RepID=UPI00053C733F|nr:PREDICTED: uncharacterized protein LOC104821189 [Tarenaya hassleriana]
MSNPEPSREGSNREPSNNDIFRSLQMIMDRLSRLEVERAPEPHMQEPIGHPRQNQPPPIDLSSDVESDIRPRHRPRERVVDNLPDRGEPRRHQHHRPREIMSDEESDPDYIPKRNPPRRARPERWANQVEDDNYRPIRGQGGDLKLKPPLFVGRIDPEAYLDWERRMDNIFECYSYSDRRQVQYAAAQLAESTLAWWDRELTERRRAQIEPIGTWREMKALMRKRYIPPHFHRELQRKYRRISQGARTVEEYFEEFEHLRSRLVMDEDEETVMAQFLDGFNESIARKVERHPYQNLHELLHLAVQIEKQNQRKQARLSKPKPSPSNPITLPRTTSTPRKETTEGRSFPSYKDKGKAPETSQSRTQTDSTRDPRSREIICFKCRGRGHMARDCPNARVMIITDSGEYESLDEEEAGDLEEEIAYPDSGELLVTRRVLSTLVTPEETVCGMIIDSGSCTNVASAYMVKTLDLSTEKHPHPYKLQWLNNSGELKVTERVKIPFSIGKYRDEVLCDVVPMQAGHILLGRPWQFDREVTHDGRANQYSFVYDK